MPEVCISKDVLRASRIIGCLCILGISFGQVSGQSASSAPVGNNRSCRVVQPYDLKDVRLLDGPFKRAQELNRRYLHELDANSLLYNFRVNAGLATVVMPGRPLGGWEAPHVEVRGHFVGHYFSACALMYASTGDEELKAKADAMVTELAKCQKALGSGYLSAFPKEYFDRLEAGKPIWVPWYMIHKIMAGMLDMYLICGNEQAFEIARGMADWAKKRTDRLSDEQMARVLDVEFGGLTESLFTLYKLTGNPDHLALAERFDHKKVLDPLAEGRDELKGLHVNTTIPKILGAARGYEVTGRKRYHDIADFFYHQVTSRRCYCTGGTSYHEVWAADPGQLSSQLSAATQECCTTHNMLKLARYMFSWTADAHCADYYERTLFNGILGTQNPQDGMFMYYVPLDTGHTRQFGTPYESFWCCYGTGIESFAKLGDSIYFHDDKGIYVNLFIASQVHWAAKNITLEQKTHFPEQPETILVLHTDQPIAMNLHVRRPYWAKDRFQIEINGTKVAIDEPAASYVTLGCTWKEGDVISVSLPMNLHAHPMPDDPELMAIMYGPLVLAGLTKECEFILANPQELSSWIQPVEGKPLTFRTVGLTQNMTFIPFNQVVNEPYGIYWLIFKKDSPRHKKIMARKENKRYLDARLANDLIDQVKPSNEASEKEHHLRGANTQAAPYDDGGFRHALSNGWWSWDMKVLPDDSMTLLCKYWGSDLPPRTFDILIDEEKIATQTLDNNEPGEFFQVEYTIPKRLTRGKEKITVKFQAHEGNVAGGVFGCVSLKGEPRQ